MTRPRLTAKHINKDGNKAVEFAIHCDQDHSVVADLRDAGFASTLRGGFCMIISATTSAQAKEIQQSLRKHFDANSNYIGA